MAAVFLHIVNVRYPNLCARPPKVGVLFDDLVGGSELQRKPIYPCKIVTMTTGKHDNVPRRDGVLDLRRTVSAAGDLEAENFLVETSAGILIVAL